MSEDKKETLKKVLLTIMGVSALGRIPAHAATMLNSQHHIASPAGAIGSPTLDLSPMDSFHDVFNNADPYVQSFGDLFVLDSPFWEISCW